MNQQFYIGIVENRTGDPLKLGRVQVRVFGVHSEFLNDVPTSTLPWAVPIMPASASISGIGDSVTGYLEGTMVFVFFLDGESKQQPIILGSTHGIPQSMGGLLPSGAVIPEYAPSTSGRVTSGTGILVTDSSGMPVQTEPTETTIINADEVDISKMVAKFGTNVTVVFNTLKEFGITDKYAQVAILSNIAKESEFKPTRERMTFSTLDRLRVIFPSKFKTMPDAEASTYLNQPEKLANLVYSNSDGNGNVNSGDGHKYRGGGFIQLTKRNNYKAVGAKIGVDLEGNPDLIVAPEVGAKAVAQYFINTFGGAKRLTFSSLDDALYTVTKKVNYYALARDLPKVTEFAKLCKITDSVEDANEKEAAAVAASPNDPVNDVDLRATTEQINTNSTAKPTLKSDVGFKDPNNKYPLRERLKEPDTNRLARSSIDATQVSIKSKNRRSSIRSVGGTFSEPLPAFNGRYPYNHVSASESGHLFEVDDTPGSERIHTYHKSGTFSETDVYGTKTNKIIGDSFTIIERNGYVYIDGTARITVGSDVKLVIAGDLNIEVDGNLNYNVGGDVVYQVGGSMLSGIGNSMSAQCGGSIAMDGSTVNLNSGASTAISPQARSGTSNDYAFRQPETAKSSASIVVEDSDTAAVKAHLEEEIAAGNITKKEVDDGNAAAEKPEKVEETVPPPTTKPLPESCAIFNGLTDIPETMQISKRYTVGMLTTKAAASSAKIKAQHGLSVSEIACNLKKVAENCLDVIKAQYPKMLVTSGFRYAKNGSQHEKGQAIDMQFGVPNSQYFEIATWIRDNVLFDQLLLEYKTIESGNAWIHVSYSDTPRRAVYTYMNHENKGTGLRKLQ